MTTSVGGEAPGDEKQVAPLDFRQTLRSREHQPAVAFDQAAGLGGDYRLDARNTREDRVRSGEVELRQAGIERFDDDEGRTGHERLLTF